MFDPNIPQEGTEIEAVQMRGQHNGLKALIDAVATLTAAQVDGTNTLPPGTPANASVSVIGQTLHGMINNAMSSNSATINRYVGHELCRS
jgi:hypothetical protein